MASNRIWQRLAAHRLSAAATCLVIFGAATEIHAQLSRRIPPIRLTQGQLDAEDAERDIVLFAAGAVELRPPLGWWIREMPYGREVRLCITPADHKSVKAMPGDGIWLTYHAADKRPPGIEGELLSLAERRARLAVGRAATLREPVRRLVGTWPAIQVDFEGALETAHERSPRLRGTHILARTDWGIFEWHNSAPQEVHRQRLPDWQRMLNDLRLAQPRLPSGTAAAAVRAAAGIIGTWKAYRSRLRLLPEGRIEIELDRSRVVPPRDDIRPYEYVKMSLVGQFRAQGDLLFVEWQDGSKLNLRWKLDGGNLLLTDHEGQISLLHRLYE